MPKIYPGIKRKSNHYNNQVRNQNNCYTLLHPSNAKKKKKSVSVTHLLRNNSDVGDLNVWGATTKHKATVLINKTFLQSSKS